MSGESVRVSLPHEDVESLINLQLVGWFFDTGQMLSPGPKNEAKADLASVNLV